MFNITDRFLLYSNLPDSCILMQLSGIYRDWEQGTKSKLDLIHRVNHCAKQILDLATSFGFDNNLWHNYLTYLMMTWENSFTLTCEMKGATEGGSINSFALQDYELFMQLFNFDFAPLENDLGITTFSLLTNYHAIPKQEQMYNKSVSSHVRRLSTAIEKADTPQNVFAIMTDFYKNYGVGMFGMNRAFRVSAGENGKSEFIPISNIESFTLDHLVGYDIQKKQMRKNVEGFVSGKGFNNMLLYGDAGTGKSTSVKALLGEYAAKGLRIIEIYKYQFHMLGDIISTIKNRHYYFMLFIDDLSFEENEVEYKFLKAVIEGGMETRPSNVMICATSNRRHLIKETWNDRNDMEHNGDIHRSDTMEEKLSLAARFGCAVNFNAPNKKQYEDIVKAIAARTEGINLTEEELLYQASRWEIRHGGISGRTAQQFINDISGASASVEEGNNNGNS